MSNACCKIKPMMTGVACTDQLQQGNIVNFVQGQRVKNQRHDDGGNDDQ